MAGTQYRLKDLTYDLVLAFFNFVVDVFFREIHPRSSWRSVAAREGLVNKVVMHAH
jgi:hypothetical protein